MEGRQDRQDPQGQNPLSALISEKVFADREDFCRERTQGTQRKEFASLRSLRSFVAIIFGCGYAALSLCASAPLRLCVKKHLRAAGVANVSLGGIGVKAENRNWESRNILGPWIKLKR